MIRSFLASRPKAAALLLAGPVLVASTLVANVGTASAHHLNIKGSADCTATVKFEITSWSQTEGGANNGVKVDYRVDDGQWKSLGDFPLLMKNDNKASGSFKLENHTKAMEVDLRAGTTTPWGNGTKMDDEKFANDIKVPAPCGKPSASITDVDCVATESTITMKNEGDGAVEFTVLKDTSIVEKVSVGAKSTKSVKVKVDKSMKIGVVASGMSTVEKTVTPAKDCAKPSASVKVVCDTQAGSGAIVTLTNGGKVSETFTITRDGDNVGGPVTLEAGKSTQVRVPMGEDTKSTIKVTSTGGLNTSKELTLDCEVPATTTTTVAPTTTVVPTTVPVTEPPVEVQGAQLAKTGTETMPLSAIAMLLVAAGAGMLRSRSFFAYSGKHFG